jgi:hypothetical protein
MWKKVFWNIDGLVGGGGGDLSSILGTGAVSWFYIYIYVEETYKMFPDIWEEFGRDLFNGHREWKGGRIPLLYQISKDGGEGIQNISDQHHPPHPQVPLWVPWKNVRKQSILFIDRTLPIILYIIFYDEINKNMRLKLSISGKKS